MFRQQAPTGSSEASLWVFAILALIQCYLLVGGGHEVLVIRSYALLGLDVEIVSSPGCAIESIGWYQLIFSARDRIWINVALRSSRASFLSSLIRCASSVVVPGRVPWFGPRPGAPRCSEPRDGFPAPWRSDGWRPWPAPDPPARPTPVLVARSPSSSEYFLESHDSDPSVSSLPPSNPGRFMTPVRHRSGPARLLDVALGRCQEGPQDLARPARPGLT